MQNKSLEILTAIKKNPHYKGTKCEHPNCPSEMYAIGVTHTSYLFIVDKEYNVLNPLSGIWENCTKCKKQFFACNSRCYKELNKQCFNCQKCKIRKCGNKGIVNCEECSKRVCHEHLLRCMKCNKRVCPDKKCRQPNELYCLVCWCPVCNNLGKKSCWCSKCHSLHNQCRCNM